MQSRFARCTVNFEVQSGKFQLQSVFVERNAFLSGMNCKVAKCNVKSVFVEQGPGMRM